MKENFFLFWPIITLFTLSSLIIWPVFLPGYFSHHDDLHVMRIFEMRKCLEDFQIPCRWVPDMGFGNGYPLFNYYPPLPYYIGAILSFAFGFIGAAKALFLISLTAAGLSMYFLAKELFGKWPGFVAAILYLFAPYRGLDVYVRGAIDESWAIAIIPLCFYFTHKLIKKGHMFNFYGTSLTVGLFCLSHNILLLFFIPLLFIWIGFFLFESKRNDLKTGFIKAALAIMTGFALSAFFLIPAFFEKSLAQIESLTSQSLDFRAHFVTSAQLFLDRGWGYGASVWGANDKISFQIGWPHWWIVLLVILISVFKRQYLKIVSLFAGTFLFSIFMTHNKSAFIWERIEILKFVQFPWRFLSVAIFSASLLGGALTAFFRGKELLLVSSTVVLLTVFLNWSFFKPETFYTQLTDKAKLSGDLYVTQQKASILDYLPKTAQEPKSVAPNDPQVSGEAKITNFNKKSASFSFNAQIFKKSEVEIPIFEFPNWQIFVNGSLTAHQFQRGSGRIKLKLEPGEYFVEGKFTNTLIRQIANLISLLTLIILCVYPKLSKLRYNNLA